jgi:hypothetical protein
MISGSKPGAWILGLLVLVALTRSQPQERSRIATYAQLLPDDVRPEILAAWKAIPFDGALSLHFRSGEVIEDDGRRVDQRVQLFEGPRFDVWVARLDTGALHSITVDKASTPRKAYFASFAPERVAAGSLPRPVPFETSCLSCHANGPRAIRPEWSQDGPVPDASGLRRLADWNRKIASYGRIGSHLPSAHLEIASTAADAWETVSWPACVGCHNEGDGIRGPLRRMHGGTIQALVRTATSPEGYYVRLDHQAQAIMPMGAPKLAPRELDGLKAWLDGRPRPSESGEEGERLYVVDPSSSRVRIVARSSLGTIPIGRIPLSGTVSCEANSCRGEVKADLRRVSTGISLRDRHLRERYLEVARFPSAELAFSGEQAVSLSWHGKTVEYPVSLRCGREANGLRCRLARFDARLSRHAIEVPAFLAARVRDEVSIEGEIFLREWSEGEEGHEGYNQAANNRGSAVLAAGVRVE